MNCMIFVCRSHSRCGVARVWLGMNGVVACLAVTLCAAMACAQGLDGALLELHSGGGIQRYRLVAETQNPPNEPTTNPAGSTSGNEPNGPSEPNAQNEPNPPANPSPPNEPNAGLLKPTFASLSVPAMVHVQAMDFPLGAGTSLTASYSWDFGDPGDKFNTIKGFNAAHIYDKPGTYRVMLKLQNEANVEKTYATTLTIPPDRRRTVYADASNFSAAVTLLADDTKLLLKRGDRFDVSKTITIEASNVLIGAYGEGADPVLVWTGKEAGVVFTTTPESRDVLIQNLAFDCIAENRPMAIRPQGKNLAVRGCTFLKVNYAINNNAKPSGVFALDNVAPNRDSIAGYFAWVAGEDHVYLGNTIANSLKAHIIRMSQFKRVLAANNDFTNHTFGGITVQKGSFAYVAHNVLKECDLGAAPLGGADGIKQDPNASSVRTSWVVIENNRVIHDSINVGHGAEHVMVRNNFVEQDANTAYHVSGWDSTYQRGIEDIWLLNNVAVNQAKTGKFLRIEGNSSDDGSPQVTLCGNTYIAPIFEPGASGTAVVYVIGKDLRCFREVSGNTWPRPRPLPYAKGGYHYVWPKWSDAEGYRTPEEWTALGAKNERYENVELNSLGNN